MTQRHVRKDHEQLIEMIENIFPFYFLILIIPHTLSSSLLTSLSMLGLPSLSFSLSLFLSLSLSLSLFLSPEEKEAICPIIPCDSENLGFRISNLLHSKIIQRLKGIASIQSQLLYSSSHFFSIFSPAHLCLWWNLCLHKLFGKREREREREKERRLK